MAAVATADNARLAPIVPMDNASTVARRIVLARSVAPMGVEGFVAIARVNNSVTTVRVPIRVTRRVRTRSAEGMVAAVAVAVVPLANRVTGGSALLRLVAKP